MSLIEADSLKKITIHHLKRFGYLKVDNGYISTHTLLTFRDNGEAVGSISASFDYGKQGQLYEMTLSYNIGDAGISRSTPVRVVTMPCNYGGTRFIFKCPSCDRNCYKLYLLHTYFRCRICHNLTYENNNHTKSWRNFNSIYGVLFDDEKPANRKAERYPTYKGRYTRNYIKTNSRYSRVDLDRLNAKLEAML